MTNLSLIIQLGDAGSNKFERRSDRMQGRRTRKMSLNYILIWYKIGTQLVYVKFYSSKLTRHIDDTMY